MKCINHYIGNSCNKEANPNNICIDVCGRPLVYCDSCWEAEEK